MINVLNSNFKIEQHLTRDGKKCIQKLNENEKQKKL